MSEVPEREDVDEQFRWALETVYDDEDRWEQDYDRVEEKLQRVGDFEDRLLDDPETLYDVLQLKNEISRDIKTLQFYAGARQREDTRRSEYQEMKSRAADLGSKSASVKSFVRPELEDADPEKLESMMDEYEPLQTYEHYFDEIIRMQEHTLPKEQEQLLSEIGAGLHNQQDLHQSLMNADMSFPTVETPEGEEVEVTHSSRRKLLKHEDREFREEVYRAYLDAVTQFENTLAANFNNKIKTVTKEAKIRGYDSSLHKELKANNIPTEVYHNLIEVIRDTDDLSDRKRRLRREAMGLDEVKPWDGSVSLAPGDEPEVEYEEAKEHILEALEPLGEDYIEAVREGLDEEGWADIYPNRGKRSGAFSWGTYDTQPFLMMNYEDDLSSMYTLAHELGHSMHSLHANEAQEYVNASYPIFTAEVASNVHEALLTEHLLEEVEDDAFRRHVVDQQLSSIGGSLFGQTMFADFEQRVHDHVEDGGSLTADNLSAMYRQTRLDHGREEQEVDEVNSYWLVPHHFYRPFYVYQYATGVSAALSLTDQILDEDDPEAAERYRDFLRSGGKDYPTELLDEAGVDLTSTEPIEDAVAMYEDRLTEMERIVVQDNADGSGD